MSPSDGKNLPVQGLAVCYTCFNSMRTIERSLRSALALADRVVAVDSGSTDGTLELCRDLGVETVHRDWTTTAEQKGFAMSLCADSPWTLVLDSDETVQDDLAESIRSSIADAGPDDSGFSMNRVIWLHGKPLRHTFQPEWRLRLVRSEVAEVSGDRVGGHDRVGVRSGRVHRLQGSLRHDSWANVRDMLDRGVRYGARAAGSAEKGGRAINLLVNPPAGFLKQLVLRRSFLDGWRGWVAAGGVASQSLAKHIAIMERRSREREDSRSS